MLRLSTSRLDLAGFPGDVPFVARVSAEKRRPQHLREKEVFLWRDGPVPDGYRACLYVDSGGEPPPGDVPGLVTLPEDFRYLTDGDIVRLHPSRGQMRVLFRRNSPNNSFLVTERCNHLCLMCSQPPRNVDDGWLIDEILETIPLIDPTTREIGFTGGEPTVLGERFLGVLQACKEHLPNTAVHLLTNGRRFADEAFVSAYARLNHPDLMAGIPLYSDLSTTHDYVVQADGAYDETIRGILNLKRLSQLVEIRVVLHKQTCGRLPQLAEFITRNLTFVDHVALMGLEITGYTRANLDALWIDPVDYGEQLFEAVQILDRHNVNVSIYNLQLCLLDRRLWRFARKSISDWKNEYMPECGSCRMTDQCAGFFSSAVHRYSDHITPIAACETIIS